MIMTTDPALQSIFSASDKSFDDDDFTSKVMSKSRFARYRNRLIVGLSLVLITILITLLSDDVQQLIIQFNDVLTTDIVDLGEGMASVVLDPVNTVAGILFIAAKLVHTIIKWVKK